MQERKVSLVIGGGIKCKNGMSEEGEGRWWGCLITVNSVKKGKGRGMGRK